MSVGCGHAWNPKWLEAVLIVETTVCCPDTVGSASWSANDGNGISILRQLKVTYAISTSWEQLANIFYHFFNVPTVSFLYHFVSQVLCVVSMYSTCDLTMLVDVI